jgi:cysteine desulfuration protein SufE
MTLKKIQNEIVEEFSFFEDWMERYEHLIELGKELPEFDSSLKVSENLIRGCQSKVWIHAEMNDEKVMLQAHSDAILTKGMVALLLRVFNNRKPTEILNEDLFFIDKVGLKEHLSPTRANGLLAMVKQIKLYAVAHQANQNSTA